MKFRLTNSVNNVDLDHLPSIDDFKASIDRGRGLDP